MQAAFGIKPSVLISRNWFVCQKRKLALPKQCQFLLSV
jgi:hypothetical protein